MKCFSFSEDKFTPNIPIDVCSSEELESRAYDYHANMNDIRANMTNSMFTTSHDADHCPESNDVNSHLREILARPRSNSEYISSSRSDITPNVSSIIQMNRQT